jgi:hypothetical protein
MKMPNTPAALLLALLLSSAASAAPRPIEIRAS